MSLCFWEDLLECEGLYRLRRLTEEREGALFRRRTHSLCCCSVCDSAPEWEKDKAERIEFEVSLGQTLALPTDTNSNPEIQSSINRHQRPRAGETPVSTSQWVHTEPALLLDRWCLPAVPLKNERQNNFP